jgi:hypothetical protein
MICRLLCKLLDRFAPVATPAQSACEDCPDSRALKCTDRQAATCKIRLDAIESAKGVAAQ